MSIKIKVSYTEDEELAGVIDPAALSFGDKLEAAAEKGAVHEGVQCDEA